MDPLFQGDDGFLQRHLKNNELPDDQKPDSNTLKFEEITEATP
jgi:hypothetical protein